jgi:hypothetical protein
MLTNLPKLTQTPGTSQTRILDEFWLLHKFFALMSLNEILGDQRLR